MSVPSIKSSDPDPVYILRTGIHSVTCLKFSSLIGQENEVLICGNNKGDVQIWELKSKRMRLTFSACNTGQGILQVDHVMLDGKEDIVSHDRTGKVKFWRLTSDNQVSLVRTVVVHDVGFCPIQLTRYSETKCHWMAYPYTTDSQFRVMELRREETEQVYTMKPDEKLGMVMQLKLFEKEATLLVLAGYEDGSVYLWDVFKTRVLFNKRAHQDPVMCIAVDKHAQKFVSTSADHVIAVHRLAKDHFEEDSVQNTKSSGFSACCVRDDSRVMICGGWDGKIRVYGWKKMKPLAILKYHETTVNSVCFNRDNLIAAACKDGKISLWDVYSNA